MLERGGTAMDAALAAGFAATVAEPMLTSLGGGGFLLAHEAGAGRTALFDFFVDSPGMGLATADGATQDCPREFVAVPIAFAGSTQVFHAGWGSVAVPGTLKGLLHCHRRLATLAIEDIVSPALRALDEGVEISERHEHFLRILSPILTRTPYGMEVFGPEALARGRLYNPLLREFLALRDPGAWDDKMYGAGRETGALGEGCGSLTPHDLAAYAVAEREPLRFNYRGREIVTNPPPALGGTLLRTAFATLEPRKVSLAGAGASRVMIAEAQEAMSQARAASQGTTHVSVIDERGNACAMTCSNGSNSGCFMGSTGILLNNMMGEEDLHPGGLGAMPPGLRVPSMMAPTLIYENGLIDHPGSRRIVAALGSGGSVRIRSAMLQVIHNLIDRGYGARDAVEAPRIHLDEQGTLQLEPGLSVGVLSALSRRYPMNIWEERDVYFGGANVVLGDLTGHADSRRGGVYRKVQ
jgi:gamma-glutamyltranspeptidase/glutathione hydrolase